MSFNVDDLALVWPMWKEGVTAMRSSQLLPLVHAVYIGYVYRKLAPKAEPVPWLLSNSYIPTYALGYILVCQDPTDVIFTLIDFLQPLTGLIFDLADAVIRGFALCSAVDYLRSSGHKGASTSYFGQILIGVITVTGGGITFKWLKYSRQAFRYPGWDFSILTLVTFIYVFVTGSSQLTKEALSFFEVLLIKDSPQDYLVKYAYSFLPRIRELGLILGVPTKLTVDDWRFLVTAFVLVGFLLRPFIRSLFTQVPIAVEGSGDLTSPTSPSAESKKDK
ncbi:hypothetical protein HDU97_003433 [Phlyctochytrium planicorne]|nr:hypothetical protein HDU97_003433 [Phlyctochytrium planicorne]